MLIQYFVIMEIKLFFLEENIFQIIQASHVRKFFLHHFIPLCETETKKSIEIKLIPTLPYCRF